LVYEEGTTADLQGTVIRYAQAGVSGEPVEVTNGRFERCYYGVFFNGKRLSAEVVNNSFANNQTGLYIRGGDPKPDMLVTGNSFEGEGNDAQFGSGFGSLDLLGNRGVGKIANLEVPGASLSKASRWDGQVSAAIALMTGEGVVENDTILTLGAGTVIQGAPGSTLRVRGQLVSEGTTEKPVVFTSYRDNSPFGGTDAGAGSDWQGLVYEEGTTADLQGTVIRYAQVGLYADTADLNQCTFYRNYYGASIQNGGGIYRSSVFIQNQIAIQNQSNTVIDALQNYWGDPSGPYNATSNPNGKGNPVSDHVLIDSFYTTPNGKLPGDLNNDGVSNIQDVTRALQFYLGLQTPSADQLITADVRPRPGTGGRDYGDGQIRADDLNWLLRCSIGLAQYP
jgi:hypothetical protein